MELFGQLVAWFGDPANWTGSDGIPQRVTEHLVLSGVPLAIAVAIAVPVGAWVGHTGHLTNLVINVANVGRAIPSLAILAVTTMLLQAWLVSIGLRAISSEIATVIAMIALAIPPILTNAAVGIGEVDDELVEAGRGMGMREGQVLRRVELPVALPVILVGVRTAAVQVVATATLGAVFATGGLGRYIIDGIAQGRRGHVEVFAGALLVAALSVLTDLAFSWLNRRATSAGLRSPEPASTLAAGTAR